MTANEKLVELIENDKLTDEQQDNLNDWGIQQVSELEYYLIITLKELQNETDSIRYEEVVSTLYKLLNYNDDEYVIYDYNGVNELDFDTLNDALDIDQKRRKLK